jgi:hypothetical protein
VPLVLIEGEADMRSSRAGEDCCSRGRHINRDPGLRRPRNVRLRSVHPHPRLRGAESGSSPVDRQGNGLRPLVRRWGPPVFEVPRFKSPPQPRLPTRRTVMRVRDLASAGNRRQTTLRNVGNSDAVLSSRFGGLGRRSGRFSKFGVSRLPLRQNQRFRSDDQSTFQKIG